MTLKDILTKRAVFAFNSDDFVIYKAIAAAAKEAKVPVILQVSPNEAKFFELKRFTFLVKNENPPLFLNLDHGRDLAMIEEAVDLGFDMVHFDGSNLSWEENIALTKKAVALAHKKEVLVEGEPQAKDTEPETAAEFIQKTGVDIVAVFVGNCHGIGKTKERLDFEKLAAIKKAVGGKLLALHGGSGVDENDLKRAIRKKLVAKINFNTLLRRAYFEELRKQLAQYSGEKVYELMEPIYETIKKEIKKVLEISIK
jgi:fructose/tagatose bisphosphate aldolase